MLGSPSSTMDAVSPPDAGMVVLVLRSEAPPGEAQPLEEVSEAAAAVTAGALEAAVAAGGGFKPAR
jgi:hypothetical protein